MTSVVRSIMALALAVLVACLSSYFERVGPGHVSYGNLCGQADQRLCMQLELAGGFPFAFLSDTPGVSVERQLSFGEDAFHPGAFLLDVGFYFAGLLVALSRLTRRGNGSPSAYAERSR